MKNIPQLRFADFEGEWESRKLKSLIMNIGTGSSKFHFIQGGYPILGSTGIIGYDNQFDYDGKFILIARVGANAGTLYKYNGKVKISDNTIFIKTKNQEYIYNLLLKKDLTRLVFGSGQPLVKSSDLKDLQVLYSKNEEEQDKIGELFKKIDGLIEKQESKVFKMEDFKKSMLQKMFPQKGQLVPELRFDGFDGEWKSSKLKHIGLVKSGVGFPEKFQGGISGIPFFKVSDMNLGNNNIIMKNAQNYVSESDIITNKWNVITDKPAIIFAKVGAAIFLERKRIVTEDFLIDNNMMTFIPKVKSDLYFYKVFLDKTRLTKYAQSGALPSYNANDIYSIPINLPSVEEQEKIGQFFKNLDTQIETEEKLLESYKQMKKSLLQKMFV